MVASQSATGQFCTGCGPLEVILVKETSQIIEWTVLACAVWSSHTHGGRSLSETALGNRRVRAATGCGPGEVILVKENITSPGVNGSSSCCVGKPCTRGTFTQWHCPCNLKIAGCAGPRADGSSSCCVGKLRARGTFTQRDSPGKPKSSGCNETRVTVDSSRLESLGRPSAQVEPSTEGIGDDLAQKCPKDLRQSSIAGVLKC